MTSHLKKEILQYEQKTGIRDVEKRKEFNRLLTAGAGRKFKEYKILKSYRWIKAHDTNKDALVLSNFEKKVEAYLRDGWVLQGGIQTGSHNEYFQALAR